MPGLMIAPHWEVSICDEIGASTVRIDYVPMSGTFKARAKWEGSDPWVSSFEIDEYDATSTHDMHQKIKSGLLCNRVRG